MGMLSSFVRLALSKPMVTLKLINFQRVKNILTVIVTRPGNLKQLYQRYRSIYLTDVSETLVTIEQCPPKCGDIVIFSVIDWSFRFQRPQQLATAFAQKDYRVFYIATTPLIAETSAGYVVECMPVKGVLVVQLASGSRRLPNLYLDSPSAAEIATTRQSLQLLFEDFNVKNPIAIVQHPYWAPTVMGMTWNRLTYDCMDHHAGFCHTTPENLLTNEKELIAKCDVVVASSVALADEIKKIRACTLIRNGCEFVRFSAASTRSVNVRPVIGYMGAIAAWFDMALLLEVAQASPQWDFILVGSAAGADIEHARDQRNIHFKGELPYSAVPEMVASFDVCLIPFKITPLTLATNPVKVYEYLAAGRPVVATQLPELTSLHGVDVFLAQSSEHFRQQIEQALFIAASPERIAVRKAWASEHDWSNRASSFITAVNEN